MPMSRQGFDEFAGLAEHQHEPLLRGQTPQVGQFEFQLPLGIIGRELQDAVCAGLLWSPHTRLCVRTQPEYRAASRLSVTATQTAKPTLSQLEEGGRRHDPGCSNGPER